MKISKGMTVKARRGNFEGCIAKVKRQIDDRNMVITITRLDGHTSDYKVVTSNWKKATQQDTNDLQFS